MKTVQTAAEHLLRRERLIVIAGLVLICLLSWYFLIAGAGTGMSTLAMTTWELPPPALHTVGTPWPASWWLIMILMWWVMMIAMMVPSAAPMILLYARVYRHSQKNGQLAQGVVPTATFLSGYLVAWLLFSLAATGLHWGLEQLGLVHGMMMWSTSPILSGVFLLAAGVYQTSPLKRVCLSHCRSPASYLSAHWRTGSWGTFRFGFDHGLYCVGCCWFLMLLLFVGGVMNLVWIVGLAIFVLVEKVAPRGDWVAKVSGVAMMGAGVWLLLG
jgi:predicted metal-binding membrane protein